MGNNIKKKTELSMTLVIRKLKMSANLNQPFAINPAKGGIRIPTKPTAIAKYKYIFIDERQ